MALTLEDAIARVPQWEGADDLKTSSLAGGITNLNFKVDVGNESFVLRIVGENTGLLGINREAEYAANLAAGELGIAPEVVYLIRPEGYLVTRFIEGRPILPDEIGQPENIRELAGLLHKIHSMPPVPGTFIVPRIVEDYTEIAKRRGVAFPENFDWLIERLREAEDALKTSPYQPTTCHNDLINKNFLHDGRIRILDWEYAGMGDIYFDLANLSVNHYFSDEQDRWLLECYFGEVTTSRWARLKIMKILSDFRESIWATVQIGISELDFDFRGYADKHFDRMTVNMKDPRWGQWLKEVCENV